MEKQKSYTKNTTFAHHQPASSHPRKQVNRLENGSIQGSIPLPAQSASTPYHPGRKKAQTHRTQPQSKTPNFPNTAKNVDERPRLPPDYTTTRHPNQETSVKASIAAPQITDTPMPSPHPLIQKRGKAPQRKICDGVLTQKPLSPGAAVDTPLPCPNRKLVNPAWKYAAANRLQAHSQRQCGTCSSRTVVPPTLRTRSTASTPSTTPVVP